MAAIVSIPFQIRFETRVIDWRGPSPYFFAPVPPELTDDLRVAARAVSYGWGMLPVEATIAGVTFTTSLYPKDSGYLLPLKDAVRRRTAVTAADLVTVDLAIVDRR